MADGRALLSLGQSFITQSKLTEFIGIPIQNLCYHRQLKNTIYTVFMDTEDTIFPLSNGKCRIKYQMPNLPNLSPVVVNPSPTLYCSFRLQQVHILKVNLYSHCAPWIRNLIFICLFTEHGSQMPTIWNSKQDQFFSLLGNRLVSVRVLSNMKERCCFSKLF